MLMNLDPIIAVKDVKTSSKWYQSVFGSRSKHGGDEFDILVLENDEVLLCLHKWNIDEHPTMIDPSISPGNGLILYLRTKKLTEIRNNAKKIATPFEEEIHINSNTRHREFSLRDPDGYYWTVSDYHVYEG